MGSHEPFTETIRLQWGRDFNVAEREMIIRFRKHEWYELQWGRDFNVAER